MQVSLSSLPIGLPLKQGEAFEVEERDLLLSRCKLVFAIALIVGVFLIGAARLVFDRTEVEVRLLGRWEGVADLAHLVSFALAFASLYVGRPGIARLQRTALGVLSMNLVLAVFNVGLLEPDYPPALLAALFLFMPAAVIPWRLRHQALLATLAVLTPLIAQYIGYTYHPNAQSYWSVRGGPDAFWDQLLASSAGLLLLASLSVLVTRTLYNLRKTAHEAERLGNYIVERKLGEGGMAAVYLARHARMVRPSAVKVLRLGATVDHGALSRFEREIQLASGLTHPNTIRILDFGRAGQETFYYAMEYLEGVDLEALIQRFGPVPPARVVFIMRQVCGSLAEAHANNVVHRDLKPSNIFLTNRGGLLDFVKVLDFGLAKRVEAEVSGELTQAGQVFGTPRYMSPEQWADSGTVDPRADVYCLGLITFFLLTGSPPFDSSSPTELLFDHLKTIPKLPPTVGDVPIPVQLDAIVMRCLEKQPEERFQSVTEVDAALSGIHFDEPWTARSADEWWRIHRSDAGTEGMRPGGLEPPAS